MTRYVGGNPNDRLPPEFAEFLAGLNEHRVEFVLIGSYAIGVYGIVRATEDIDFLYRRTVDNVDALCRAMVAFGAPQEVVDEEALMRPNAVVQFGAPPYRIDVLNAIDGVGFEEVWSGSMLTNVSGQLVRVIGAKELLANKTATGRIKDAQDATKLRATLGRKKRQ